MGDETGASGGQIPMTGEQKINALKGAGIIDPDYLSEAVLDGIKALSDDQIKCLIGVHDKVPLAYFVQEDPPQR